MKYPILNNCLEFTRRNTNEYVVYNGFNGTRKVIAKEYYLLLKKFDGKTLPAKIFAEYGVKNKREIDRSVEKLIEDEWIRDTYYRIEAFPFYMLTAWIPDKNNLIKTYSRIIDNFLRVIWAPLFLIGLIIWKYREFSYTKTAFMVVMGLVLGTVCGALLHELGHMVSAYANKKKVYELGVGLIGVIPFIYTLIDTKHISTRKELRILSAGVKMNLAFSGLLFFLGGINTIFSPALEVAAMINLIYAIMNTVLAYGLDGMKTIQYLMFDHNVSVVETFMHLIKNGTTRRELVAKYGFSGNLAYVNILVIFSFQVFYPILCILILLEVF